MVNQSKEVNLRPMSEKPKGKKMEHGGIIKINKTYHWLGVEQMR